MKKFSKKQKQVKNIAKEHMISLFKRAKTAFSKNPALSNRYITLARRISMKHKIKIPRELKRTFCRHCYKFLMPGKTCRIRTHKGKVVYYCLNCKKHMH